MNPYMRQLGSRDPFRVAAATARHLEQLYETIGPERIDQPSTPGKWSPKEILCHLADCEMVFGFRLRQVLAENDHVLQPFDQDKWSSNYAEYDACAALTTFSCIRQWNLMLLRSVPPEMMSKRLRHPERGEMSFKSLVEIMAGHDLNHLAQLEAIVGHGSLLTGVKPA